MIKAINKRDALTVGFDVYEDLISLLNVHRSTNKSSCLYNSRCSAQISELPVHGGSVALQELLITLTFPKPPM